MKKNKRTVGMVVFSYYPEDPRVRREAEVLERAGMDVDIICLRAEGQSRTQSYGRVTAYRVMRGTDRKEHVMKYFALSSVFALISLVKLLSLSRTRSFRLIQAHNMPDFLIFTGAFHKAWGVPLVLDLHDLSVELFVSKCSGSGLFRLLPLVKLMERLSCSFADSVITTSEGFRDRLIARGTPPGKITLVLNSADDHIFARAPERRHGRIKDGPVLLYHGTVARRFGLHVAVEAVEKLRKSMPGIRLFIYGKYDPAYKQELEGMVRNSGLEVAVTIGGYLPLESIITVIGKSDIGIVPYLSDPFMNLALSTKVFEYVSMKMPVVASRLDSITSIFDDKSIEYFNPGDPFDLAERIKRICNAPARRKANVERAARAYETVSWPVMSSRYLNTVSGLMSAGKSPA